MSEICIDREAPFPATHIGKVPGLHPDRHCLAELNGVQAVIRYSSHAHIPHRIDGPTPQTAAEVQYYDAAEVAETYVRHIRFLARAGLRMTELYACGTGPHQALESLTGIYIAQAVLPPGSRPLVSPRNPAERLSLEVITSETSYFWLSAAKRKKLPGIVIADHDYTQDPQVPAALKRYFTWAKSTQEALILNDVAHADQHSALPDGSIMWHDLDPEFSHTAAHSTFKRYVNMLIRTQ